MTLQRRTICTAVIVWLAHRTGLYGAAFQLALRSGPRLLQSVVSQKRSHHDVSGWYGDHHHAAAFYPPDRRAPPWKALSAKKASSIADATVAVGNAVGSGSYGTVHVLVDNCDGAALRIGKRAWTRDELVERFGGQDGGLDETNDYWDDQKARCDYYFNVEAHCFRKLGQYNRGGGGTSTQHIPTFRGVQSDGQHEWLVWNLVGSAHEARPAPTLSDLMERDRLDHWQDETHHLYMLGQALGVDATSQSNHDDDDDPLAATLDVVMEQLLQAMVFVHGCNIVHRDIKPGNILVDQEGLYLVDFGSAADLDTAGPLKANIGLSERVAISPIYAAPECFVDASVRSTACKFDVFSVALLYCQLLFQYLDERTDAGFHQQLANVQWKLDDWLRVELQGTVIPTGLTDALQVLNARPGLWKLLQDMLQADPRDRISSADALDEFRKIHAGQRSHQIDGPYLQEVLQSLDLCLVPDGDDGDDATLQRPRARPLHFVATFDRKKSLGLLLAEADADVSEMNDIDLAIWQRTTHNASPGEVFVQGVVPLGQADDMGIFEIGDRLQGIGELPLSEGGFGRAVTMLEDQPRSAKYVTLRFDRRPVQRDTGSAGEAADISSSLSPLPNGPVAIVDQGAWSSRGQRKTQEDMCILHQVHEQSQNRDIVLAGVFDGHLGAAAAKFCQHQLPALFTDELPHRNAAAATTLRDVLEQAWEQTCDSYRFGCTSNEDGTCIADYDPREGILMAKTGSMDAVAGTTASAFAVDPTRGEVTVLNCGDSRTMVADSNGAVVFQTLDHKPEFEIARFLQGIKEGLDYSAPQCLLNRWFVKVNEYEYAISRGLEGPIATSKGVIAVPDITTISVKVGYIIVSATDGLWDVVDPLEAGRLASRLRIQGRSAADVTKILCSMALEKQTADNVSAVVVYV